jgi:hypothetical protein
VCCQEWLLRVSSLLDIFLGFRSFSSAAEILHFCVLPGVASPCLIAAGYFLVGLGSRRLEHAPNLLRYRTARSRARVLTPQCVAQVFFFCAAGHCSLAREMQIKISYSPPPLLWSLNFDYKVWVLSLCFLSDACRFCFHVVVPPLFVPISWFRQLQMWSLSRCCDQCIWLLKPCIHSSSRWWGLG